MMFPVLSCFPSLCVDKVSGTLVILKIPHDMCLSVQLLSYFSVPSRHEFISSTLSWSKAQKSETVESIREIAGKEEKQLFTMIATGVFPRNSYFVYSSAHGVSVSAVASLMGLDWIDVQHRQGRNKCRNLGSAAAGCLLGSSIWRLMGELGLGCWERAMEGDQQFLSKQERAGGVCGCTTELCACHDCIHGVRKADVSKAMLVIAMLSQIQVHLSWSAPSCFYMLMSPCSSCVCWHTCLLPKHSCHFYISMLLSKWE